jgi:hypothetical protein
MTYQAINNMPVGTVVELENGLILHRTSAFDRRVRIWTTDDEKVVFGDTPALNDYIRDQEIKTWKVTLP